MPCDFPLPAWRARRVHPRTKRLGMVFKLREGLHDMRYDLPCGQCMGCRLERSRQWAVRMVHESRLHADNTFISLTYAPEHLPRDGGLHVEHYQSFMKRLREDFNYEQREVARDLRKKIRFFHCGEYGEKMGRPHYHAIIFGYEFADKKPWKVVNGYQYYTSAKLEKLWGLGYCAIGAVTFESAAYVARYITKKITGDVAAEWYSWTDPVTGEIHGRKPEYCTMSRRPGIAGAWISEARNLLDTYPSDTVALRGRLFKPPRFYDAQLELAQPGIFRRVKLRRKIDARDRAEKAPYRSSRHIVELEVRRLKLLSLKRGYENDSESV